MTTFTEKELDALWDNYCEAGNANGSTENGEIDLYDIDGMFGAAAEMRDAITYLRAQLSERDPIGAVIMRERAIDVLDDTVTGSSVNSWVAIDRASNAIKDLPLPTPAETLAYALELPEIKALVTKCNGMVKGDYPSESLSFMAALKDHVEELEAALAALEPKP